MHPWLRNLSSRFDLNETFTRADRHEVTLRYAIWFIIFVLLVLLPQETCQPSASRHSRSNFLPIGRLLAHARRLRMSRGFERLRHRIRPAPRQRVR